MKNRPMPAAFIPMLTSLPSRTEIARLRRAHGAEGFGVYTLLLLWLASTPGYTSERCYDDIAFIISCDAELVRAVVEDFGLFAISDDGKAFYNPELLEDMAVKDAAHARRVETGRRNAAKKSARAAASVADDTRAATPSGTQPASPPDEADESAYADRLRDEIASGTLAFLEKETAMNTGRLTDTAAYITEEWRATGKRHRDYDDFRAHAVNTVRKIARSAPHGATAKNTPLTDISPILDYENTDIDIKSLIC